MKKDQREIETSINQGQAESQQATQKRFENSRKDVQSESLNLLIQNPPAPKAAVQPKPPLKDPEFTVDCDGGCFLDGDKNLIVLLRNVIVKEERFTLKAQEEIKVFFLAAPEEENNKDGAKKEGGIGLKISEVKSLIASGGVHFSGIDKEGNPVEATAATAFYDDQEKVLILKDGKPTFWTKKEGAREIHLQAVKAEASVRIELEGETMSAQASPTGWALGAKPAGN